MRDILITLSIVGAWSWLLFMAGYISGRKELRDTLEQHGYVWHVGQHREGRSNGTGARPGHAALAGDRIGRDRPGVAAGIRAVRG